MKKRLNITIFTDTILVNKLASIAAISNGMSEPLTLQELAAWFKVSLLDYPENAKVIHVTLTDHSLFIDKDTVCACEIEEVEVAELLGMEEATDEFIDGINYQRTNWPGKPDDVSDIL